MRRIRLDIAYDGSGFHGWAAQGDPAVRTVQGELEDRLALVLRHPVSLTVAGRTDAGVHATGQVAHCDVPSEALEQRSLNGDPGRLVRRLSRLLEPDLRVWAATDVPPAFDARFSALRRRYCYRVSTAAWGVMPTRRADTAVWPHAVSPQRLQLAAAGLTGLRDFAAFCKARPHATTIRKLEEFRWEASESLSEPEVWEAHVVADAFCWHMVRSLVGYCLAVASGRLPLDAADELWTRTTRSPRIPMAPACGLTLTGVDYPPEEEYEARARATRAVRQVGH